MARRLLVFACLAVMACGSPVEPTASEAGGGGQKSRGGSGYAPFSGAVSLSPSAWTYIANPQLPNPLRAVSGGLGFTFPTGTNTFNYLYTMPVKWALSTSQQVTATYTVSATPGVTFHWDISQPAFCNMPPFVVLFFWGNNLDAGEHSRWWAYSTTKVIAPGSWSMTSALAPSQWFSVYGVHGDANIPAFMKALGSIRSMGVTFGGGCYYGHGVSASGPATFALTRYEVR